MGQKYCGDTKVRLRDWHERVEGDDTIGSEGDITISLTDRLEMILQLRDVQDLAVTRMYEV